MQRELSIIKIGGNVIDNEKELSSFLHDFSSLEGNKILVHGGGKKATEIGKKLGITPNIVDGRRVTDSKTLDVALMVYGGLTNKKIIAQLQSMQCNAIGLSGADGNSIQAVKRPIKVIDYGYVGDIVDINTGLISSLLKQGLTPVFCALTHDKKGIMLNTNADTIASEIASAMSIEFETRLIYCFEKSGVLDKKGNPIQKINKELYNALKEETVINLGMIPKLDNAFNAKEKGVEQVFIKSSKELLNINSGTEIC